MPRGENPNSRKALAENRKKTQFHGETAVEAQKKSAVSQRVLSSFRDLDRKYTTEEERKEMLDMLKLKARRGNLKAFEVYRDTVGLKPRDSVEVYAEISNPYASLTEAELKKLARDG